MIKVMMNPIRIRILQELGMKEKATTKELQAACGDIAQATLYRHLNEMLKNEIIHVVGENVINGIIERVYAIHTNVATQIANDPKAISPTEYLNMFSQYIISILTDFKSYMSHKDAIDQITTSIGFSSASLFLTAEELHELASEIHESINKRLGNEPAPGRKLRKISTIITTTL